MKLTRSLLVVSALLAAAPAAAQQRAAGFESAPPVVLASAPVPAADTIPAAGDTTPQRTRHQHAARRGGWGVLGWAGGALVGGVVGIALYESSGSGDDEWGPVIGGFFGGMVGSTVGAGVGAAMPRYGSRCSFPHRLGNAVLGSAAGALAGVALAVASDTGEMAVVVPLGSAAGAALAVGC
jgi:hypothetical protein